MNEGFTGWDTSLNEVDLMIGEEGVDGIVIDGSWLYYQKSTEKEICRINLNGDYSKEIVFSTETIDNPEVLEHLTSFTLYNEELYIKENTITCFRYDVEKNQLVSFNNDMPSGVFLNNKFYYTDHAQRTYSIYATDLSSLQTELVRGDGTSYKSESAEKMLFCDKMAVVNGRLIYSTRVNPAIYIYEEKGEDLLIEDLRGEDVIILDTTTDGQYYYYSHQNSNILCRYDLNQDELELIELPENFKNNNGYMIIDDNLYYRSDHEIYKILLAEKSASSNMIQQ